LQSQIRGQPSGLSRRQPTGIASAGEGTQYTCPMHPEVISDRPGDCPKCGMALEPMGVPDSDEGPNRELIDFTRRLWISAGLAIPLLILSMGR